VQKTGVHKFGWHTSSYHVGVQFDVIGKCTIKSFRLRTPRARALRFAAEHPSAVQLVFELVNNRAIASETPLIIV
jgi:hypothetical protein